MSSHPNWCDLSRCSVARARRGAGIHRSATLHGTFDPDLGQAVDVSLWEVVGEGPHVLFEFPGGSGSGNDLTTEQAAELVDMLTKLLDREPSRAH